ncbi:membrane transporter protein, putative [Babesia ovata]|uniref:Membrane transporter protein, putative n=1 Tax=Babesia ovata TaxID=189622 RepID=A0A2H6KA77_9APIC|nr:membrane transporter protein, putative [Babesia ovata]GBE59902.1 membrane transporter protein, putative [Babesia ovata]
MSYRRTSVSLLGDSDGSSEATEGHCEAPSDLRWRHVGIALEKVAETAHRNRRPHLGVLSDVKQRSSRLGARSIVGAGMLYIVLGYPAAFSNVGLHIASYMRVFGTNSAVDHQSIALGFVLSLLTQTLAGLLTAPVAKRFSEKALTLAGCIGVVLCVAGAAWHLQDYVSFLLWYGLGAGFFSGLAMWLPAKSVLRLNPLRRGFSCGCMYAIMGTALLLVGPLQLSYLGGWWDHDTEVPKASENRAPPQLPPKHVEHHDSRLFHVENVELRRTRGLLMFTAIGYLIITVGPDHMASNVAQACGWRWAFPDNAPEDDENTEQHVSEYVPFSIKGEVLHHSQQHPRELSWRDQACMWLLSYFTWQAVMYIHSYWRNIAAVKYGATTRGIVVADFIVRCTSLLGRIIWGLILDSHGWRVTWATFSLFLLVVTVTLTHLCQTSFVLYVVWVSAAYFANSAVFCVVPMTAHNVCGSEGIRVILRRNKGDCEPLGAEPTRASHAVKVRIGGVGHVVVDNDVHTLNVDAPTEQVSRDHDALVEVFELSVASNALGLLKPSVYGDRREVALVEQVVERLSPRNGLHENNDLVEFQSVEQVIQLAILVALRKLDVVLEQAVESQLRLVVHEDLHGRLHKALAHVTYLVVHGGGEEHNLLLFRG